MYQRSTICTLREGFEANADMRKHKQQVMWVDWMLFYAATLQLCHDRPVTESMNKYPRHQDTMTRNQPVSLFNIAVLFGFYNSHEVPESYLLTWITHSFTFISNGVELYLWINSRFKLNISKGPTGSYSAETIWVIQWRDDLSPFSSKRTQCIVL